MSLHTVYDEKVNRTPDIIKNRTISTILEPIIYEKDNDLQSSFILFKPTLELCQICIVEFTRINNA